MVQLIIRIRLTYQRQVTPSSIEGRLPLTELFGFREHHQND